MKNKTKKVILLIVEGKSDKIALERIITKLYSTINLIKFIIIKGDITTKNGVNVNNIDKIIREKINSVLKTEKLFTKDFLEIAHIIDTDGCFVDSKIVVKDLNVNNVEYTESAIKCKNPEDIISRNKQKSEIINHLLKIDTYNKIKYKCYYMSCNLDHALYNIQNLEESKKIEEAFEFAKNFDGKEYEFIKYLNDVVDKNIPNNFLDSWNYIKINNESLKRHSNFHIFFDNNPCGQYLK